jgi:uncharacterized protein YkwD
MRRPVLLVGGLALVTVVAGIAVAASASAGTMTYEAEASANSLSGGAHAVDCRRCSGGRRVTGIGLLGSLTFAGVVAERAGATRLAVTYTGAETRVAQISVNGAVASAIRFPATRGASRPGTVRITVTLAAGDNTISFGNPTGVAPDVDKLVITTDGTPPTAPPTGPTPDGPATTATAGPEPSAPQPSAPAPSAPAPSAPAPSAPTASPSPSAPTQPTPPEETTTPPSSAPTTTPPPPAGNAAFEAEVLSIVNRERAAAGCSAVTSDDRLVAAARAHSADMAARGYFSHTTPEGVEFATRITQAGYRWSRAGENIAKGQATPAAVMTGWMNSSGHKANILNCSFKNLGVGVAADADGRLVWTQDFASPLG